MSIKGLAPYLAYIVSGPGVSEASSLLMFPLTPAGSTIVQSWIIRTDIVIIWTLC